MALTALAEKRKRDAQIGAPWDRTVRILKRALPTAAVALMLVIAIWPFTSNKELSFLLAKDQVDLSEERMRMEKPVYMGQDQKGRPFRIEADRAVQKTSDNPLVELTGLRGEITLRDGPATIRADKGAYDLEGEKLMVIGDIVFDAMGYKVLTGDAILDLQTRTLVSPRGLNGTGPLGTFNAESFRVNINTRSVILERGRMRITPTR